jgi:hypothetical protein
MMSQGVGFLLPSARRSVQQDHDEALAAKSAPTSQERHNRALHALVDKLAKPRVDAMRRIQARADRHPLLQARIDGGKLRLARPGRRLW